MLNNLLLNLIYICSGFFFFIVDQTTLQENNGFSLFPFLITLVLFIAILPNSIAFLPSIFILSTLIDYSSKSFFLGISFLILTIYIYIKYYVREKLSSNILAHFFLNVLVAFVIHYIYFFFNNLSFMNSVIFSFIFGLICLSISILTRRK